MVKSKWCDVELVIPTLKQVILENNSDFATNASISEVSTNLENHETEIASVTDLGHVKVDGEND